MKPEIKELHKIERKDIEKVYGMMMKSFKNYPKLIGSFPDWEDRQAAIEMVIRYYGAFDFEYGYAYSLDESLSEVLMIMFSEEEVYTEERFEAAGSYSDEFRAAAARLGEEGMRRWWDFFDEVDRTEAELEAIPDRYIYADFLCVSEEVQGQGRGSRIIQAACRYADEIGLPIMLVTTGEEDIRFYQKNGFKVIGVTKSEDFGLENTYVLYEPKESAEAADA